METDVGAIDLTDRATGRTPAEEGRMKACVATRYGPSDVVELVEVARPTPEDDEVLIAVRAASLNAADWHLMRADPRSSA